jgi:hypothetical protein
MRTVLTYTAVLVGIYLLASHATDAGRLLSAGFTGYQGSVKVLQGRG